MTAPVAGFQPYIRREAIAVAVFNLVSVAAGQVANLVTSGRVLKSYTAIDAAQMPALFCVQKHEAQNRSTTQGIPPRRVMFFEVWLYTADPQADSVVPATQLNNMIDAIEFALSPDPLQGLNTLGGLVVNAKIEGQIDYFANVTQDGKSIAIIPVAVLIP